LLGLAGTDVESYAKEAVNAEIDGGEEGLFAKIKDDLDGKGVDRSEHQVRRELEEQLTVARTQVLDEQG